MQSKATITSKGQVTIPAQVRRWLGLREGDQIEFVTEDGRMVVRPVKAENNPFLEFVGSKPQGFQSVADVNAWVADLRDEE